MAEPVIVFPLFPGGLALDFVGPHMVSPAKSRRFALARGVALELRRGTADASRRTRRSHGIGRSLPKFVAPATARCHLWGAVMAIAGQLLMRPVQPGLPCAASKASAETGRRWLVSLNARELPAMTPGRPHLRDGHVSSLSVPDLAGFLPHSG